MLKDNFFYYLIFACFQKVQNEQKYVTIFCLCKNLCCSFDDLPKLSFVKHYDRESLNQCFLPALPQSQGSSLAHSNYYLEHILLIVLYNRLLYLQLIGCSKVKELTVLQFQTERYSLKQQTF